MVSRSHGVFPTLIAITSGTRHQRFFLDAAENMLWNNGARILGLAEEEHAKYPAQDRSPTVASSIATGER